MAEVQDKESVNITQPLKTLREESQEALYYGHRCLLINLGHISTS